MQQWQYISKRILGLLIGLFLTHSFLVNESLALYTFGFAPQQYVGKEQTFYQQHAALNYGEGVYFAPNEIRLYKEPDAANEPIDIIHWERNTQSFGLVGKVSKQRLNANQLFVAFYPQLDIAMMSVVGENGEGWAEVVYDQRSGATAWVPLKPKYAPGTTPEDPEEPVSEVSPEQPSDRTEGITPKHFGKFLPWQSFMKLNAMKNGAYWLSGVPSYHKKLRTAPEDTSKLIETMMMRSIAVKHVRGNWMLVEVEDFNHQRPIGWIRWRDDQGQLMMFPNFTNSASKRFYF